MAEVEIRFERENQEGIVAVGTYLVDAMKRFGIRLEDVCVIETQTHFCSVKVPFGSEFLSARTKAESEYFATNGSAPNERLACQVKIEKAGDVVIMTKEKVEEPKVEAETTDERNEQYRKEFADMPLEKKIAHLVQLETIALGETVSFIINSPFKIADKVLDVMAEFGFKKEEKQKEAARPAEHKSNGGASASNSGTKKSDKKATQA